MRSESASALNEPNHSGAVQRMAMPDATILEVGDWGLRRTTWEQLELVQHWKAYLDAPGRYLRHVLDD